MYVLPNQDLNHTTARTVTDSAWPNGFPHQTTKKATKKAACSQKKKEWENRFANVKVYANNLEEMSVMILVINELEN